MAFSFTGLAYLFGFFAIGLLTYRFFQYWRREKTTVSKLFLYALSSFGLFMLITAVVGLFFAKNTLALKGTVISAAFLQGLACAIFGYSIIYLKFPRISPWTGFLVVFFLGLAATALTVIIPFHPFLEETGVINWDFQPLADTFRFLVFVITFIPLSIILIQQFRTTKDPSIRTKALGISLLLIFGLITGLLDFFLEKVLKLGAISSDIAFGIFGVVLFVLVYLTQKPTPEEKYVPPPPAPKIPW